MTIGVNKKDLKVLKRYVKEFSERFKNTSSQLALEIAQDYYDNLQQFVPAKKEYADYRKSLVLGRVTGDGSSYAVYVEPKREKKSAVSSTSSIIIIKAKHPKKRESRSIRILEKYSPWTQDTLPFTPTSSQAEVTIKKSTVKEVRDTSKKRNKDRQKWIRELRAVGVSKLSKQEPMKAIPKQVSSGSLLALSLEFGLGGTKMVAHWRPAQRRVADSVKRLKKDKRFIRAFGDPKFYDWKSWPEKISGKIDANAVKDFKDFEKKIKIK